jgi:hypothetical protein
VIATAGLCGLPVRRLVEGDEIERAMWVRVATRAAELRVQVMKAEAAHVAVAVSRLFK